MTSVAVSAGQSNRAQTILAALDRLQQLARYPCTNTAFFAFGCISNGSVRAVKWEADGQMTP